MLYKNSFKLLFSNSNLIWKTLIFLVVNTLITLGLAYIFVTPIINLLYENNFFETIYNIYGNFLANLNLAETFSSIRELIGSFIVIITENINYIIWNIVLLFITVFFVYSLLNGLFNLILCDVLYNYMSNKIKFSYMGSFINTFWKNIKYNLAGLLTYVPFNALCYLIIFSLFRLFSYGGTVALITPFLIILVYIVLMAIKITLFSGWAPAIVTLDNGVFAGLYKGMKVTFRRFIKVFNSAIALVITIFAVNVFAGIATFGVSLLVTVPVSLILISCFNMVSYYNGNGMRYYIDENNVFVPIKLEKTELMQEIKYMI